MEYRPLLVTPAVSRLLPRLHTTLRRRSARRSPNSGSPCFSRMRHSRLSSYSSSCYCAELSIRSTRKRYLTLLYKDDVSGRGTRVTQRSTPAQGSWRATNYCVREKPTEIYKDKGPGGDPRHPMPSRRFVQVVTPEGQDRDLVIGKTYCSRKLHLSDTCPRNGEPLASNLLAQSVNTGPATGEGGCQTVVTRYLFNGKATQVCDKQLNRYAD